MKVDIDMGTAPGRTAAMLDLEELLATRLLVQGNSGSGKSHLLRRLLEQSAAWVQQVIIDPEGDFVTLADRFGHVVVDAQRTEAELIGIAGRIRQHRVSVVLNLEGLDVEQQMRGAAAFLSGMFDADREFWYPVLVVVDEAQLFAPAVAGEVSDEARKVSLGAMTNLMCRGRKRGLAGVIATQRLAKLAKNVAAEASNFLMGRTFLDIDMARAADLLGMERRQAEMFRDLARGNFVALGPALSRRPLPIEIGQVETSARSVSPKLTPLPEASGDVESLILAPGPEEARQPIRRHRPPQPTATADIMAQLARSRPEPETASEPVFSVIDEAERETLLDAIVGEMVEDPDAAFRTDALLYQDFLVRCRIRRVPGEPAGAAGIPSQACRRQGARRSRDGGGRAVEAGAGAVGGAARRRPIGFPDRRQGGHRRRGVSVGPRAGARLRHAFGAARAQASHLFRGARGRRRAHRFPRQAHRRLSRPWLRDRGWRSGRGGWYAGRRGGRIRRFSSKVQYAAVGRAGKLVMADCEKRFSDSALWI